MKLHNILLIILFLSGITCFAQDSEFNLLEFDTPDGVSNVMESYGKKYTDAGSVTTRMSMSFLKETKQKVIMGTNVPKDKYDNVTKSFQTEEVLPLIGKYEAGTKQVYLILIKEVLKEYCYLIKPLLSEDESYTTEVGNAEDRFYLLLDAKTIQEAKAKEIYQKFAAFYNVDIEEAIREANK